MFVADSAVFLVNEPLSLRSSMARFGTPAVMSSSRLLLIHQPDSVMSRQLLSMERRLLLVAMRETALRQSSPSSASDLIPAPSLAKSSCRSAPKLRQQSFLAPVSNGVPARTAVVRIDDFGYYQPYILTTTTDTLSYQTSLSPNVG